MSQYIILFRLRYCWAQPWQLEQKVIRSGQMKRNFCPGYVRKYLHMNVQTLVRVLTHTSAFYRELVEKLHGDNNPLGSCVLASEIKFRCMRIELLENCTSDFLEFQDVAATLALHVVGAHGVSIEWGTG